ncbi:MAG: hypothetical protein ABIK80_07780 [candidate division WOR-3 bacterium]
MIKNKKLLEELEKEIIKNYQLDINKNIKIFQEFLKLAREVGRFPAENLLEGIEIDIKYAKAINGIKRTD